MPRGRAGLRHHGAADGRSRWRPAGYALLGCAGCVTAQRHGPDVRADECLPFGALAGADLWPTKRWPWMEINNGETDQKALLTQASCYLGDRCCRSPTNWSGKPNVNPARTSFTGCPFVRACRNPTSKLRLSRTCQMKP